MAGEKLEAKLKLLPANLLVDRVAQLLELADRGRHLQRQLLQVAPDRLVLVQQVHLVERALLVQQHLERVRHAPVNITHLFHLVHVQEELQIGLGRAVAEPGRYGRTAGTAAAAAATTAAAATAPCVVAPIKVGPFAGPAVAGRAASGGLLLLLLGAPRMYGALVQLLLLLLLLLAALQILADGFE